MAIESTEMEEVFRRRHIINEREMDLSKLATKLVGLTNVQKDYPVAKFNNDVNEALRLLNVFETSASLGKSVARSAEVDKAYFATLEKRYENEIKAAREQIIALRMKLAEDNLTAERRKQYNVLANKIANYATIEESRSEKEKITAEIAELEKQTADIDERKHIARCEFRLLLQSVDELDALTKDKNFLDPKAKINEQVDSTKEDVVMKGT
eukprot:Plantae.Rhodophyta-Hildenbrandia_rubra.ctg9410.p2 GENE.Plantae.Rhodophyta-Hildenbrandia_rubra.ctg9410~~Plantae.Rhodophyta-Hildenbrandia_rubra.ctg9410.p2  ORF type:complete len:211 (-),score=32.48 Plantae.Rhodophyta-Hildenbrandia_rubra.ctg9410:1039-1671(-)